MTMNPTTSVLVVEDEPKLANVLIDYVVDAGMSADWIDNGSDVIARVQRAPVDMVLLDLMLPGKDGLTVMQELRQFCDVPVIMITAKVEEIDRLIGLEAGADDYICKPFSPREVIARINTILRRVARSQNPPANTGFVVNEENYAISLNGEDMELTQSEFILLAALVNHPGRIYPRDTLLDKLGAAMRDVSDRAVDSHIKNLRKKLAAIDDSHEYICSVYGIGYKLDL